MSRTVAFQQLRRAFHAGKPNKSSVLDADNSNVLNKYYHGSMIVLAGLTPLAFIVDYPVIRMPIDLILGFAFPFHGHVGMNYVISDYVPKNLRSIARGGLLASSIILTAGLFKLNVTGNGLTETVKSLWKKPVKAKKSSKGKEAAGH